MVSRGARHLLAWTLTKLAAQQAFAGVTFELILVDNASDAETRRCSSGSTVRASC